MVGSQGLDFWSTLLRFSNSVGIPLTEILMTGRSQTGNARSPRSIRIRVGQQISGLPFSRFMGGKYGSTTGFTPSRTFASLAFLHRTFKVAKVRAMRRAVRQMVAWVY